MQTRNPFIDDLTKMANGAMGALTGMKDEVEARVRDQIAKILDGMDIPRRDEFDAVKAMAAKAREENEELRKQIAELQAKLAGSGTGPEVPPPGAGISPEV
jgi:BMFP domain-containing protein YqiC